jgi:hypothetical protein
MTVHHFPGRGRPTEQPPSDGGMDGLVKRIEKLEESLVVVREIAVGTKAVLPHIATKADVNGVKSSLIQWFVGTTLATATLAFAIARYIS